MNDNFGINNTVDLYKRLLPALNCKLRELEKSNYKSIRKEDIWNFLIKNKWQNINGLCLADMVDDILNINNEKLIENIFIMKRNIESNNIETL